MAATTLETRSVPTGSAQDILQRLERYAAERRSILFGPAGSVDPLAPARRFDAATVDLFPYDLIATVAGCAATIVLGIVLARPFALAGAAGLAAGGEWARRTRWFPSVGTNLLVGTLIGVVLVLLS